MKKLIVCMVVLLICYSIGSRVNAQFFNIFVKKFGNPVIESEIKVPDHFLGTSPLIPGKTYKFQIIPIQKKVSAKSCINYLKMHNAISGDSLGLVLVLSLKRLEILAVNDIHDGFILSFNSQNTVHKDSSTLVQWMSSAYIKQTGEVFFKRWHPEYQDLDQFCYLLCFFDQ